MEITMKNRGSYQASVEILRGLVEKFRGREMRAETILTIAIGNLQMADEIESEVKPVEYQPRNAGAYKIIDGKWTDGNYDK